MGLCIGLISSTVVHKVGLLRGVNPSTTGNPFLGPNYFELVQGRVLGLSSRGEPNLF